MAPEWEMADNAGGSGGIAAQSSSRALVAAEMPGFEPNPIEGVEIREELSNRKTTD